MAPITLSIIPLLAGYLLDLLFGDPQALPHPVRLFGYLIEKGEAWFNRRPVPTGEGRGEGLPIPVAAAWGDRPPFVFIKGMVMVIGLCSGTYLFFSGLLAMLPAINVPLYLIVSSILVFYGLANRQLIVEGKAVFTALQTRGLEAGRLQLSRIVGRDTSTLSPFRIRIAVLETMAENLGDGVVAPLFYYALAGVPGMLTYKMINTLDSMIGYRSERYAYFGKFAARLDDVANFIPARLTALLMIVVTGSRRGVQFVLRYGHRHKSPNAGYPEAALAGIIDARFGGPNLYHGIVVDKPYIGENTREIFPEEIVKVSDINNRVCLLMIILIVAYILKYR